jgi:hypothetical protein
MGRYVLRTAAHKRNTTKPETQSQKDIHINHGGSQIRQQHSSSARGLNFNLSRNSNGSFSNGPIANAVY